MAPSGGNAGQGAEIGRQRTKLSVGGIGVDFALQPRQKDGGGLVPVGHQGLHAPRVQGLLRAEGVTENLPE
jgi:hypothetical protein